MMFKNYRDYKEHLYTFTMFGMIGLATAMLYFVLLWIFEKILNINYMIAVSSAYVFSNLLHFSMNRIITFKAHSDKYRNQLWRYGVIAIFNYAIVILVVGFCVENFGYSSCVGSCCAIVSTAFSGYILSRYWVFRETRHKQRI